MTKSRLAVLLGALLATPACAAESGQGGLIPLRDALTAAWTNDPVRQELATNARSADARAAAARSWFAGGPILSASYYDDRPTGNNLGYITYEGGVSVPLWLPGQGSATEDAAHADARSALARVDVERMAIAVKVLEQSGALLLADRRLTAANAMTRALEHMTTLTTRAHAEGEGTGVDMQAMAAQLADARREVALAEEAQLNARSALRTLLGIPGTPDLLSADPRWLDRAITQSPHQIEENDPRVQAAERAVTAAQAQLRVAHKSFMPNPEIGVDAINQGQYGSPWVTQLGVNVRVQLPSDVTSTPQISAAQDRLAAASRAETDARRAVHIEFAQVLAHVTASRSALTQARLSAAQTFHRADAMEKSWSLGETPLIEALRAREDAWRALLALNQAEISWHAAIVRFGISTGTLP